MNSLNLRLSQKPTVLAAPAEWLTFEHFTKIHSLNISVAFAYFCLGCSTGLGSSGRDDLLGARWSASLQGRGERLGDSSRLYVGGSRWDDVLCLMQPCGPVDLPAVGSLVAGLTWDVGGLCPWAGILSWRIFPGTFGRSHPRPRPVLLPEWRQMHQ